jgi:hypothetical protein
MKKFGLFLLAKDTNAIMVAFLCALLPVFGIPTGFLAAIIVGLVTLQKGPKSGLSVLPWVALPTIALLVLRQVGPFDLVFLRCVVICILSILLRRYPWRTVLQTVAVVLIAVIVSLHIALPNLQDWWTAHLTKYIQEIHLQWKMTVEPSVFAKAMSPIATGVVAFLAACSVLLELVIARLWQCALVNPGAFAREFLQIRIKRVVALIACVLLTLALLKVKVFLDALPLVLLPFFIAGLSLLHYWMRDKKQLTYLLVFVYVGLLLVPAFGVSALALLAFVDTWCDFRKNVQTGEFS